MEGRKRRRLDHRGRVGVMQPQVEGDLHPRELEEAGEDSSLEPSEGHGSAESLLSDFWPPEL